MHTSIHTNISISQNMICFHSAEKSLKFLSKPVKICYELRQSKQYELRTFCKSSPAINIEPRHSSC